MQNYATEELLNGSISVSRSFVPSSRCQLDKTIEETIRKHAKCHKQASGGKGGGLFGVENFLIYGLIISLQERKVPSLFQQTQTSLIAPENS